MNEDYEKYLHPADTSNQLELEAMKKLLERGIAAKDNTDHPKNEISHLKNST